MKRQPNTNRHGSTWTLQQIKTVWLKGKEIQGFDPDVLRMDKCGNVMRFDKHGEREHQYGWEIDHIHPVSDGGTDDYNNLQPLYWKNNADKSDKLNWTCPYHRFTQE